MDMSISSESCTTTLSNSSRDHNSTTHNSNRLSSTYHGSRGHNSTTHNTSHLSSTYHSSRGPNSVQQNSYHNVDHSSAHQSDSLDIESPLPEEELASSEELSLNLRRFSGDRNSSGEEEEERKEEEERGGRSSVVSSDSQQWDKVRENIVYTFDTV